MAYLERECRTIEEELSKARAKIAAIAYDQWQRQRLSECDQQLVGLAAARADFENLKRHYAEVRDHHRSLRLKLRRDYYKLLKLLNRAPNDVVGIEDKVMAFLQGDQEQAAQSGQPILGGDAQGGDALQRVLNSCREANRCEVMAVSKLAGSHEQLRGELANSKHLALRLQEVRVTPLAVRPSWGVSSANR